VDHFPLLEWSSSLVFGSDMCDLKPGRTLTYDQLAKLSDVRNTQSVGKFALVTLVIEFYSRFRSTNM